MIKVIGEAPEKTYQHVCRRCGYRLEYTGVDLESAQTDCDGDRIEKKGYYLTCPRKECRCRQWVREGRDEDE